MTCVMFGMTFMVLYYSKSSPLPPAPLLWRSHKAASLQGCEAVVGNGHSCLEMTIQASTQYLVTLYILRTDATTQYSFENPHSEINYYSLL